MSVTEDRVRAMLAGAPAVIVTVVATRGSTPRETDAWMLVSPDATLGTIGGGQLEFMAIDHARSLLGSGGCAERFGVPLGPEIGQCCGGRVTLDLAVIDNPAVVVDRIEREQKTRPDVYLFGAGHVGQALARTLSLLPLSVHMVETRAEMLGELPDDVETRVTVLPEEIVTAAPPGAAFVILTHDHALDFLIALAALERDDAAYVGMIGSKSKRRTFENRYLREGGDPGRLASLTCPIGTKLPDKRPQVIAALVAAELLSAFSKDRS